MCLTILWGCRLKAQPPSGTLSMDSFISIYFNNPQKLILNVQKHSSKGKNCYKISWYLQLIAFLQIYFPFENRKHLLNQRWGWKSKNFWNRFSLHLEFIRPYSLLDNFRMNFSKTNPRETNTYIGCLLFFLENIFFLSCQYFCHLKLPSLNILHITLP